MKSILLFEENQNRMTILYCLTIDVSYININLQTTQVKQNKCNLKVIFTRHSLGMLCRLLFIIHLNGYLMKILTQVLTVKGLFGINNDT